MIQAIADYLRQHIFGAILAAVSIGATGGAGVFWSIYEAQINRVEEMKVAEFNELMTENKKFLEMLNSFTEEISVSGVIDPQKKKDISSSLARLYTNVGAFTVNLPVEKEMPVRNLQSSINEVKKHIQLMHKKQDLDTLSVALVDMFRNLKLAQPIIEAAVGKTPLAS
ncbi:hypothetical protein [Rhizobium sp. PL01]|uniref:hypothetical protein n=1 Tax=Rhizobium sp. PL01 TaxID=3085631 RepID=UPI002982AB15|nr:hypothetical protein [Rhizobium sp. PL01]MDW5315517.1 hypothetical protein [Rhizobium sp. PL01]